MEYTNNEKFSKPDKNDLYSLALWNENTEKTDAALAIAGKPDEYSTSKTYAVGDKCIYENALYKCITAISTAEAWTAGHWAKTSLCAEDTANKAAIKELTEKTAYVGNTKFATTDGINLRYIKFGKEIQVSGEGKFSKAETITSSKQLLLGTLPEGVRPNGTLFYPLNFLYANAGNLTLSILKDGTVSVCTTSGDISIASGKYFNFIVQFIQ